MLGFVDLAVDVDALVVEGREPVVDVGELGNKCGDLRGGVLESNTGGGVRGYGAVSVVKKFVKRSSDWVECRVVGKLLVRAM